MLYCKHCKIEVSGTQENCPLCHCNLSGEGADEIPAYPTPKQDMEKLRFIFNSMRMAAIASCVVSILINYITFNGRFWSGFVVAGIACGWFVMAIGIPRKANLIKVLQWELYITCGLAVVWDYFTGWHGWSLEFVLPCTCMAVIILIFILSAWLKKQPKEYLSYMTMVNILGFLPILFLVMDWVEIRLPSVICIGCSAVFLVGILLFKRNAAYGEMKKKLHI